MLKPCNPEDLDPKPKPYSPNPTYRRYRNLESRPGPQPPNKQSQYVQHVKSRSSEDLIEAG